MKTDYSEYFMPFSSKINPWGNQPCPSYTALKKQSCIAWTVCPAAHIRRGESASLPARRVSRMSLITCTPCCLVSPQGGASAGADGATAGTPAGHGLLCVSARLQRGRGRSIQRRCLRLHAGGRSVADAVAGSVCHRDQWWILADSGSECFALENQIPARGVSKI